MNGFEKVTDFMENLQDTAAVFADYKPISPDEVDYHEIEDDAVMKYVKKACKRENFIVLIVILAFAAVSVLSFAQGTYFWGTLLLIVTCLLISFYIPGLVQKPLIKEGYAAFKQTRRGRRSSNGGYTHTYYVTVAFEEPERTLCKLIETNKSDYEQIEESTPVLLVKSGKTYMVCLAPECMIEK